MTRLPRTEADADRADADRADADRAEHVAERAAQAAGCAVREVHDLAGLGEVVDVLARVWASPDGEPIVPARDAPSAVARGQLRRRRVRRRPHRGAPALAFLGAHDGAVHLHSHIVGLLPETRARGVGLAVKLHQRAWALARGIDLVTWTFDPLVRSNAYFNLTKLGAEATAYHPDFYGAMDDGINAGEESDRLLVTWALDSPRAVAASEGAVGVGLAAPTDDTVLVEAGTAVLLEEDGRGRPVAHPCRGPRLLCRVPADIVALRRADPALARQWRRAVRDTLGAAVAEGYRATAATRNGWYVLDRPDQGLPS